ncbi:MAG: hypothetical protein ACREUV_01855 [Burkholderiales bacterium]
MNELYAILMSWAVTLSGYGVPASQPEVVMVPHSYLVQQACNGRECKVMGWFPTGHSIYLDRRLKPEHNIYASSIVVHEMVHYLQYQSARYKLPYSCEDVIEMEREAYRIQSEFLVRYGVYQPVGVSMHHAGCETLAHSE